MRFKVRGIYDLEFFLYLKRIGVKNFAFDLRPTSFNFTPMYKIIEMLKAGGDDSDTYSFIFDGEKDFAIEQFSMRMYFPSKMNQILIDNGFHILHQWGDYYRSPLGEGSKLQIYDVCLA